jgi:uncharacterized protein (TIGR02598 family)
MDRPPSHQALSPRFRIAPGHRKAGFSLVEISLAIGIIAFAFVALLGLLPTGLTIFRSSVDTANETWIMQDLNSMIQVTDWSKLDAMSFETSGEIYYYDEEGRLTDTEKTPSAEAVVKARRLYAVKLIVEPMFQPVQTGMSSHDEIKNARRVIAVIANITRPPAMAEFKKVTTAKEVGALPAIGEVHARAFIAARMDSEV